MMGPYPFPNNYAPQRAPTPPTAGQAPDVNIVQFKAAKAIEDATHLSADGERVYLQRLGNVRVCYWNEKTKRYESSFPCPNGLPPDAVAM